MPTLTITVNGQSISKDVTLEQMNGLLAAKDAVNLSLDDESKYANKEIYFGTIISNWASSVSANSEQIDAMITQCLNSWSSSPSVEEVETPELTGDELKTFLKLYTANKRWTIETGGMNFNGINIPTDDRAKLLLMGAANFLGDSDTAPFVVSGQAVNLTGAQFKAIYDAMVSRVQSLFREQADIGSKIDDGTFTSIEEINQYEWTQ